LRKTKRREIQKKRGDAPFLLLTHFEQHKKFARDINNFYLLKRTQMSIGGCGGANSSSCCSSLVLFSSRVVVRLLRKATNTTATTTRGGGGGYQQQQHRRSASAAAAALSGGTSFNREKTEEENSGGNLYFRRRRRCLRRSGGGAFCRSLSSRGEDTGNNNNNNNMGSVVPKNFTVVAKSRRNNGEEVRYEHEQRNTDTRKLKAWLEERGINSSETFASSSSSSSSNEEMKQTGDDAKIGLKSIEDLLKEIENGETVLIENTIEGDGGTAKLSCVRRVSVVVVEITSKAKPNKKLIEYEQTLPSGATRRRERFLSEKIMSGKGETPLEAAKRGIREELGNALDANAVVSIDETSLRSKEEDCSSSQSYRDLPTRYRFYEVKAEIEGLPVDSDAFTSVETCGTKAVWKWV
jgi:hypothetical protein